MRLFIFWLFGPPGQHMPDKPGHRTLTAPMTNFFILFKRLLSTPIFLNKVYIFNIYQRSMDKMIAFSGLFFTSRRHAEAVDIYLTKWDQWNSSLLGKFQLKCVLYVHFLFWLDLIRFGFPEQKVIDITSNRMTDVKSNHFVTTKW